MRMLCCSGPLRALRCLADLYGVSPRRLEEALSVAVAAAQDDATDPVHSIGGYLERDLGRAATPPGHVHVFHGTRARRPEDLLRGGIPPMPEALDDIWAELGLLAYDVADQWWSELRADMEAAQAAPPIYRLRVGAGRRHGPFGHLLLGALLSPRDYGPDRLALVPAVVHDICCAARERFGIALLERYLAHSVPCAVEYVIRPADTRDALAAAAWYVASARTGQRSPWANWQHDMGGHPVGPMDIVCVRALDHSERLWSPQGVDRATDPVAVAVSGRTA